MLRSVGEHKSLLLLSELGNSQFNYRKGSKTDVLSSSPLSDRIKGLWVVCGLHNCGVILKMGKWKNIFSCSQIISRKQHKCNLTGAGNRQPVLYFQAWQKIYTKDDRETHPACVQSGNRWIASRKRWLLATLPPHGTMPELQRVRVNRWKAFIDSVSI